VTFATPEPDASYYLNVTPVALGAGTPTGATHVVQIDKTSAGFTVYLEAAPGVSGSVGFDWQLSR
jgi:hypothetical protein